MPQRYSVCGRCSTTVATADVPAATLWNPSSIKTIYVREVSTFTLGVAWNSELIRTSTRGTPGTTVTPDIDNDRDRLLAPPSGALLDLCSYAVNPTVQGPAMARMTIVGVAGSGYSLSFNPPIAVPAGTGLAIANALAASCGVMDVTFVWEE